MKIRDIKNKELRELATSRMDEESDDSNSIGEAFFWEGTLEGGLFWKGVNDGLITEIPKDWVTVNYQGITSSKLKEKTDFKEIPNYYVGTTYKYEARKVIEDFQPDNYNIATALTYLLRAGKKPYVNNSLEESKVADIQKAINHLQFELDRCEK